MDRPRQQISNSLSLLSFSAVTSRAHPMAAGARAEVGVGVIPRADGVAGSVPLASFSWRVARAGRWVGGDG